MSKLAATQSDCFALCDDSNSNDNNSNDSNNNNPRQARSRLYTGYLGSLICHDADDLPDVLNKMQLALQQGQLAVGLFAYELGAAMQGCAPHAGTPASPPLAELLLFAQCQYLTAGEVTAWLQERVDATPAGIAQIDASVSEAQFNAALARIHAYIEAGDTYQVNYTYRLRFDAFGPVCALYLRLRQRQPVPYGALISLPDGRAVLSLSPELFVRHSQGELTVRPMKGTAAASEPFVPETDAIRAAALKADPKNRAENLMIVDLLRNDLGRIAAPGSVRVLSLFDVARYSKVLQMTSTIQARLRAGVRLPEIFNALYPCGSITGAPKHRTMQIIRELEPDPRGIYTGAIGWFDPPPEKNPDGIGDFCLSVPIRTMLLQAPGANGVRRGEMGVGAGIVYDSDTPEEYAECHLKARFLTGLPNDFLLIETIHASQQYGCRHLERHLQRLFASAQYFFGIARATKEPALRAQLAKACAALPTGDAPQRLRVTLDHAGVCTIRSAPLHVQAGQARQAEPVRLLLARTSTDANDIFLRHKTSVRAAYDAAWQAAEQQGAFDMLFCNHEGELTEGGRSNVFLKLDGRWVTPPCGAGVLPGIMRGVLLDDPAWDAREQHLTRDDLRRAEQVVVCNALRGILPAIVVW